MEVFWRSTFFHLFCLFDVLEKEKHMCFEKSSLRLSCVTEFIQEAPFKTWTPLTMEAGVIVKLFLTQHDMVPGVESMQGRNNGTLGHVRSFCFATCLNPFSWFHVGGKSMIVQFRCRLNAPETAPASSEPTDLPHFLSFLCFLCCVGPGASLQFLFASSQYQYGIAKGWTSQRVRSLSMDHIEVLDGFSQGDLAVQ